MTTGKDIEMARAPEFVYRDQLLHFVNAESKLTGTAKLAALSLAFHYSDTTGGSTVSTGVLCRQMGVTHPTVKSALDAVLESGEWVRRESDSGARAHFYFPCITLSGYEWGMFSQALEDGLDLLA